jgi:hypothetical protein
MVEGDGVEFLHNLYYQTFIMNYFEECDKKFSNMQKVVGHKLYPNKGPSEASPIMINHMASSFSKYKDSDHFLF